MKSKLRLHQNLIEKGHIFLQTYMTAKSIKPLLLLTKHINALNDYDVIDKNVKFEVKETKILRKNKRFKQ